MSNSKDDLAILMNILAEEGLESENLLKRFARAKSLGNKTSSLQALNSMQNLQGNPLQQTPIAPAPMESIPQEGMIPGNQQNPI